ncbi:hypothetical protein WBO78_27320 [Bosea sp. CCNWLW174]
MTTLSKRACTAVLVHGARADGSSWMRVIARLDTVAAASGPSSVTQAAR